ncbi:hypothetical protein GP486_008058 [Trichoglossum hirsutum]|uniref:Uncharacterized protein n=1 Tax=Trichoglossum hirsutum TaxID=265104 RepID=A0A9P8IHI6_9PEZI|nr:hypothetical protein GP486_008058 [Trichoglossum hirsutum]
MSTSSSSSSSIRVFVHWTEQTVFAGEDVECTITFKNTAPVGGGGGGGDRQRKAPWQGPPAGTRNGLSSLVLRASDQPTPPQPPSSSSSMSRGHGHQPPLSLSVPPSPSRRPGASPASLNAAASNGTATAERPPRHKHHRSVSIIPIGGGDKVGAGGEENKTNGVDLQGVM